MFIGHFALGFAAKRAAPRVSLAALFAAAQLADIIWPFLVAFGIEQVRIQPGITAFTPLDFVSYPYSHSLVMLCVWGALFGGLCANAFHTRRAYAVIAALVVSHWVLDWVTHRPDMPLYPGGPKFGLGLWNSVAATVTVEVLMFVAGVWIYARTTRARDKTGRQALPAFVGFLLVAYLASSIGPPPPNVTAIVVTAIAGAAVIVPWAWWFDRHRVVVNR
jgi:hypothetical protein